MPSADRDTPVEGNAVPPVQPDVLGRYRLLEELGQGGMSVVFRGMDTTLEREVAVKMLHSHLAKKIENRQRFHREAKAIARLRHSNILEVYDYSSENEDLACIVMEYIRGQNLRQFLEAHGPPPAEAVAAIAASLCHALEHAHDQGVIHRDLKPENVMVSSESAAVKLMDFGIAHVIDAEAMTQTGSLMGSPAYMAPELIEGRKIDKRADIFSLGTVLYWSATGQLPFDGKNAPQVLKRVLDGRFDDPEQVDPRIGHELAAIIRRCLAGDPDERYQTVEELRSELEVFLDESGWGGEDSLKDYLRDPEGFTLTFESSLIPGLITRGRRALAAKSMGTALGCFNRVLAYDPGNEEVADLLGAIGRRATYRRAMSVIAFTMVVATTLIGIGYYVTSSPVEEPPPEVSPTLDPTIEIALNQAQTRVNVAMGQGYLTVARDHASQAGNAHALVALETTAAIRPARRRVTGYAAIPTAQPIITESIPAEPREREVPDEEPSPAAETYRFKVLPPAATVYVGQKSYSAIEAARGITLPHGRHILTARSPGCKPLREVVEVRGPQRERQPVVLEWEDGQIRIMSNHDALVWVDDDPQAQPIGAFGKSAMLRVRFGKADTMQSEKEVRLRVAPRHDLQQSRTQVVSLRPGIQTTVNVNFNAGP
ncbi:MAG: serine/threonine protein kinase [Bradymonadaceae bacterium]